MSSLTRLLLVPLMAIGLVVPTSVAVAVDEPPVVSATSDIPVDPDLVTWVPEPTVARIGPGLKLTLTLATHVRDSAGLPKAGVNVGFTLFGPYPNLMSEPKPAVIICTAVTDANGLASCKGQGTLGAIVSILSGGAYATRLIGTFGTNDYVKLPVILAGS